jgi:hypothetical protein
VLAEVRDSHQQVRLCGLAGAKHLVDVLLALGGVAGAQQGRPEQIGIREIVPE